MAQTYTTELEVDFSNISREIGFAVKTNGGSLAITSKCGNDWVPVTTITEDGAKTISAKGMLIKFTPAGGCAFTIRGN